MQRILFAKVEVWLVFLVVLLGFLASLLFGSLLLRAERNNGPKSSLAKTAISLAEVPDTIRQLLREDTQVQVSDVSHFADMQPGWNPTGAAMPQLTGFLLLSRYDGNRLRHVTELVSMTDWTVQHAWLPEAEALLKDAARISSITPFEDWDNLHFRAIHPVLMPNGDLIIKDHDSPLFRIDPCATRIWIQDADTFHHSTEMDGNGMLWLPSRAESLNVSNVAPDFIDDEAVMVDPADGKVLLSRSIVQLMLENGLAYRLFSSGTYSRDPLHLNDIQPVLDDGPHWKKGDLFLSLRNISAIMLYRPSTDEIVWMKEGPWMSQHDVGILDDHRITVYDNRAENRGLFKFVEGHSDVKVYDFDTGEVSSLLGDAMASANIATLAAGLFTALPGGYSLIEDVTNARMVLIGPKGEVQAEYANKVDSGKVFQLGWSRVVDQALGEKALAAIAATTCPAP